MPVSVDLRWQIVWQHIMFKKAKPAEEPSIALYYLSVKEPSIATSSLLNNMQA